ncbi:protein phosphatase 1 regulatory subunit 3A-like isoform X2 [Clinocottus analis]|uniref:protein phosphatase 1 regulatory subunit 3A-like isoform X2 n=1 Tax=Clinocottus analis TaxID=304258 RepID=UPI0035C182D0
MEGLHIPPSEEEGETLEEEREENGEQEEGGGMKASSSPVGSTTDEETDEDSEPEPPQVIRRKVSFADAFGLNLVSVKEFDNPEVAESNVSQPPINEAILPLEEFYMSCLFTVPSSLEELDQRLQKQMVELENIELLPGTTTLRGIVRVVNLCYSKSVYARVTLDHWTNYFELSAEYLPGSSDWKTDRFTFKYTLVPPFERGGTRVEICLRYETSAGTFWANNKDMNYVLFCHQRGHVKELWPQAQEESIGYKSKRSCLKANRRGSAEEKTRETSNPPTAAADAEAAVADRKNSTDVQSLLYQEEHKPLVRFIYHLLEEQTLHDVCVKNETPTSNRSKHCLQQHYSQSTASQHVSSCRYTLWKA